MAAGATFSPIATTTLGSAQASYTFNSIPSTYTDLVLVANYIATTAGNTIRMTFNNDAGTNYSKTYVGGYSTPTSGYGSTRFTSYNYIFNAWQVGAAGTTSPNPTIFNIMNYSNSTTYKTTLFRFNTLDSTLAEVSAEVGLWRNTAAINRIDLTSSATTFAVGSTFTLWGILNA